VAEDAVGSETVFAATNLPAICELQGDFQKLQGEPIRFLPNFITISICWKESPDLKEQGAFFPIAGKEQGAFLVLQGRSNIGVANAVGNALEGRAERRAQIRRDHARLGICNQQVVSAAQERG
jgi:hypothetical protein